MAFVDLTSDYDYKPSSWSLTGSGLDKIATTGYQQSSGPVWDPETQAYFDAGASGLYSYDGGITWEPKRQGPMINPNAKLDTSQIEGLRYSNPSGGAASGEGGSYFAGQPTEPDPFANFDENSPFNAGKYGSVSYQQAQQQNAKFQSGLDYLGDTTDSGAYQDPSSGNIWAGGVWWSKDVNYLYDNESQSWLTPAQYNDFQKSKQPQSPDRKLSPAEFQQVEQYMERPAPSPRADFFNYDSAMDPYKGTFPKAYNYTLDNPDIGKIGTMDAGDVIDRTYLRQTDPNGPGYKADVRFPTGGNMLSFPLSKQIGDAYGAYEKYIQRPVAETGAQLTPLLVGPLSQTTAQVASRFGLMNDPGESGRAGLKEFGSALWDSGGNPLKFVDTQNKNLAERPGWQQMLATTVYDPTNLIGAGLGAKALESGALEGAGILSRLASGAAKVDKGIDTAQAALFKPVGLALSPALGGEGGSIAAKTAAKIGAGTAAGAYGYATGDGMDPQDRFLRALAFAAVPVVGPDATSLVARKYGEIPFLREAGLGRKAWLEQAPVTDVLEGSNLNPVIYLKNVTGVAEQKGLPLRTKISNAFWTALEKGGRKGAAANIDNESIYWIAAQHRFNDGRIAEVAENMSKVAGEDVTRTFQLNEKGQVIGQDGNLLPALDNNGQVQKFKGKDVIGATPADIADHAKTYLNMNLITQEQYDALLRMSTTQNEITDLRKAFGLEFKPSSTVGEDGFHITRGTPSDELADKTPARPREPLQEGKTPGAAKNRGYQSEAAGIMDGKVYPHPVEAMRSYVDTALREVNAANSTRNLAKVAVDVELRSGERNIALGDLLKNDQLLADIKAARSAVTETKAELKKVRTQKARIDRDYRLGSRWVDVQRNRVETLTAMARQNGVSAATRTEAANDALELTRIALDDALSAAKEYAKKTAYATSAEGTSRRALNETIAESNRVLDRVDAIQSRIAEGKISYLENGGDLGIDSSEFSAVFDYADRVRAAVAQDVQNLDKQMLDLGKLSSAQASRYAKAQAALESARGQFSDAVADAKRLSKVAQTQAAAEARAAENVRGLVNQGKADEVQRLIDRRAPQLEAAFDKSDELLSHVTKLRNDLADRKDNLTALKNDLAVSKELGKEMRGRFPRGTIKLKGWEGVHIPTELANAWTKYEKSATKLGGVSQLFDLVNNAYRAIGATLDASRTATIGLLGATENPKATAKGIRAGVAAAKDPEQAWHMLRAIEDEAKAEGFPSLAEAVGKYNLEIASSEHTLRGMADEGTWVDRIANAPGLRHAEALYSTPGNIERAQRYYDNLRLLRARGEDWTSDSARGAAANAANVITGRATRGALAPVIGERASSRVLFAGRFVQSQIDSVYNAILVGGIEGESARTALLRLLGGGMALTYAINEGLGNETDFSPIKDGNINPNFMRIRVAGQDISLFGPWDTLIKGMAATAQGDPGYFLRGKLAPAAGIGWDLTIGGGKNQIGEPALNAKSLTPVPFGARSIGEQILKTDYTDPGSLGGLGLSVATGALGVKASPMTARERYNEAAANAYDEYVPSVNYPHPKDPQDDPLYMAEYAAKNPSKVPGPVSALGKEAEKIRQPIEEAINRNNEKFKTDETFKLGEWKESRKILKQKERDLLEHIVQQYNGQDPEEGTPAWYLNQYFKTFEKATVDYKLDFDKLDEYQAEFLASAPPWVSDYVDQYFLAKAAEGPEREYRAAIQQLNKDGYFSGKANSIPRYQNMISGKTDEEIDNLLGVIDDRVKRPEYEWLKGKSKQAQAVIILGDYWQEKGVEYDPTVITDVGNSGKDKFQSIDLKMYKAEHPELLAWLNPDLSYNTILAIGGK